jgi:hypothetical protein
MQDRYALRSSAQDDVLVPFLAIDACGVALRVLHQGTSPTLRHDHDVVGAILAGAVTA